MLDIVASYHCMQFQRKLIIQLEENGKKPHFGPDLGPLGPNFKNLASSVTIYHGQLSSYTILEKNNDPFIRKLSEVWTDGETDEQTDRRTRVIS